MDKPKMRAATSFLSDAGAAALLLALIMLSPTVSLAEDDGEKLKGLEERVKKLEKAKRSLPALPSELEELKGQFGSNLGAFGDVNYLSESREKRTKSFSLGSLGLYTTASYDERLNFLFEMVVVAHNSHTTVNLERLWAGYTFRDELILRAGRFHTAMGYWNKTYHHGRNLFVSVDRPFFIRFEDLAGVVPVHIVGVELAGVRESSHGKLRYWLELGNGPGIRRDVHDWSGTSYKLTPRNMNDSNNTKQVAARLACESNILPGLLFGFSYTHFILEDRAKTFKVRQNIYAVDAKYEVNDLELLGEYFLFDNDDERGQAYYLQLAYTLGRYTPFARYETLESDPADPYLSILRGGGDRLQYIGGVKYELSFLHSSLKAQYRRDEADDEDFDVLELQWAFYF